MAELEGEGKSRNLASGAAEVMATSWRNSLASAAAEEFMSTGVALSIGPMRDSIAVSWRSCNAKESWDGNRAWVVRVADERPTR